MAHDPNDKDYMLSTYDNPINPFTDFVGWWKYDYFVLGHDCCGLLDRESFTSDIASDEVNEAEVERAIESIIAREPLIFRKVYRDDFPVRDVAY